MSIVNAVLVTSGIAPRWVTDTGSIAQWGRIEDAISVGDIKDPDTIDRIGEAWLAPRAQPSKSHVVEAVDTGDAVGGVDYREGDWLADPDLRVAEIVFDLRPDGRFRSKPALSSKYEEAMRLNQSRVDRLIAEGGGSAPVSAPPVNSATTITAGKLQPRQIAVWSWYDEADLDPLWDPDFDDEWGWQPQPIDEAVRITELVVECSHVDEEGDTITTGPTRFRLMINGVAPLTDVGLGSLPTDVVVAADEGKASVSVFGQTILRKGDTVQVAPVVNGGHISGSVTMFGSDIV